MSMKLWMNYVFYIIKSFNDLKGRLGSTVSSLIVGFEVVGLNQPLCEKQGLSCLVYSLPQHPHQVGARIGLTLYKPIM